MLKRRPLQGFLMLVVCGINFVFFLRSAANQGRFITNPDTPLRYRSDSESLVEMKPKRRGVDPSKFIYVCSVFI